jgi:hypothetical protein
MESLHPQMAEPRAIADSPQEVGWALFASGQINGRKVDGWKRSPQSPLISQLTSPRNHIASRDYAARHSNRIPDGTIAPYMFVFLIALYIVFG